MRGMITMILAALAIGSALPGFAGECPDSKRDYIACLTGSALPYADVGSCLECLACHPADRNWAGPNHAAMFRRCRENPDREALVAAAATLLAREAVADSSLEIRRLLLLVLASWGIDHVGEYRIYDVIVSEPLRGDSDYQERMFALAVLGDHRTAGYVDATYDSVRAMASPYPLIGPSAALNCLYHIPGAKAVEVAKRIRAKEKDPILRERAAQVIARKNR